MDIEKGKKESVVHGSSKSFMETNAKMEAGQKEGSVAVEKNPVTALTRFPEEVWYKLLSFLIVPQDFISVSKTCWDLNDIVERNRLQWVPPVRMVLMPFVTRYLSKTDIRNCRLVSHGFCYDVESFLLDHPYRKFYSDAQYLSVSSSTHDNMSIFATTLNSRHFRKLPIVENYLCQFDKHFYKFNKRNPFVGRTLHLKLNGSWKMETHGGFIRQIEDEFLLNPSVMEHIWYVMITYDEKFDDVWRLWQLFLKMFKRLCNIKSVVVNLQKGCILHIEERVEFWKNCKQFPLGPLLHSRPITVKFIGWNNYGIAMLNQMIVNQCHAQLANMDIDLSVIQYFLKDYNCPNVKSLRLTSISYHDIIPILKERFSSIPLLERLTLDWRKTIMIQENAESSSCYFNTNLNMERLASVLTTTTYKMLKVVSLQGLGPDIELDSCCWNRSTKSCSPMKKFNNSRMGNVTNHDEKYHESTIWRLLPDTVKEVYLNEQKFIR